MTRGMTRVARRELVAHAAECRVRATRAAAQVDLHRQGLLWTSRERARQGDPTVAPQYRRFLPPQVRARVTRAARDGGGL